MTEEAYDPLKHSHHSPESRARREGEFLTVQEVAARLRVSKMSIYRLCEAGDIPFVRVGRQFRILTNEFEVWLRQGGSA